MKAQEQDPEPSCRAWTLTERICPRADGPGNFHESGRECCVWRSSFFPRVRCAGCAEIVALCEADCRGQVYCGGGCKRAAWRETKARDQRSCEGRFDHEARNVV